MLSICFQRAALDGLCFCLILLTFCWRQAELALLAEKLSSMATNVRGLEARSAIIVIAVTAKKAVGLLLLLVKNVRT